MPQKKPSSLGMAVVKMIDTLFVIGFYMLLILSLAILVLAVLAPFVWAYYALELLGKK